MSTPEGLVKAKIKKFLKSQPNCWWTMPVSNGMGTMGVPDFIGCYLGLFFAIEAKAPGKLGATTPLQRAQLNGISQAHGWTIVADDVVLVEALFVRMKVCVPHFT